MLFDSRYKLRQEKYLLHSMLQWGHEQSSVVILEIAKEVKVQKGSAGSTAVVLDNCPKMTGSTQQTGSGCNINESFGEQSTGPNAARLGEILQDGDWFDRC